MIILIAEIEPVHRTSLENAVSLLNARSLSLKKKSNKRKVMIEQER